LEARNLQRRRVIAQPASPSPAVTSQAAPPCSRRAAPTASPSASGDWP